YLALLANLAMLSGLLGTVSGLITSFGAVAGESVDPSQKARVLAQGISEAMNCTAFGLAVAIIGLIGFPVLNGKTQQLEDDINEASVQVLNLVVSNRQKVNMSGLPAAAAVVRGERLAARSFLPRLRAPALPGRRRDGSNLPRRRRRRKQRE